MLVLETDLDHFTQADVQAMLWALPSSWQTRVTRKKPFHSRLQSAVGYTLLRTILQTHYGITALPALCTDDYGKPYFEDCPLHFSISHCRLAVACVVEHHPVAVDVQDIMKDPSPQLKSRLGCEHADNRALTVLWTQKEASAKLDGRGLRLSINDLPLKEHTLTTTDHGDFIVTVAKVKSAREG